MRIFLFPLAAVFGVMVGCSRGPSSSGVGSAEFGEPARAPASAPHETLPPGHPPIGGEPPAAAVAHGELPPGHPPTPTGADPVPVAEDLSAPVAAGGLTWEVAQPLERRAASSRMRVAQYGVAGHAGAELVVFYFGQGQGGTVEANIERWVGQVTGPAGEPVQAERAERTTNGIRVSRVSARGTLASSMGGPAAPQPDSRLLGGIAEGPEGPVFFKLTGTGAAADAAEASFDAMLGSIRPR